MYLQQQLAQRSARRNALRVGGDRLLVLGDGLDDVARDRAGPAPRPALRTPATPPCRSCRRPRPPCRRPSRWARRRGGRGLLGGRGTAAAAQLRDRRAGVFDPLLGRGLLFERDVLLQRLDGRGLVAGVAQAQAQSVVGLGLLGLEQCVPAVGGDRGRALAHAPAHHGQRVPGLRVTRIGSTAASNFCAASGSFLAAISA